MGKHYASLKEYDDAIRFYKEAIFHCESDTKVCPLDSCNQDFSFFYQKCASIVWSLDVYSFRINQIVFCVLSSYVVVGIGQVRDCYNDSLVKRTFHEGALSSCCNNLTSIL